MSIVTLQRLRLVIPGIFLLLLLLFITSESISELIPSFFKLQPEDWQYLVVIIAGGALYYILKVRNLVWNPFRKKIDDNIKVTLINPYAQTLGNEDIEHLIEGRKLMHIFYHFIDNDKSLSEKANRVRFNGLLWTSSIDLTITSAFGSLLFWIKLFILGSSYNLLMAIYLLAIALISYISIHLLTKKHIDLSNEQLEMICQLYKAPLQAKLDELLS